VPSARCAGCSEDDSRRHWSRHSKPRRREWSGGRTGGCGGVLQPRCDGILWQRRHEESPTGRHVRKRWRERWARAGVERRKMKPECVASFAFSWGLLTNRRVSTLSLHFFILPPHKRKRNTTQGFAYFQPFKIAKSLVLLFILEKLFFYISFRQL